MKEGINEKELPQIIEKQEIPKTGIGVEQDISSSYIEDAKKIIGSLESKPEVVVDIGGGAAKGFAPELLESTGCNVHVINENLDGSTKSDPTADSLSDWLQHHQEKNWFCI